MIVVVVEIENQDFSYKKYIKYWLGASLSKIVLASTN